MPDTPDVVEIDTGDCKMGRILEVFKIQPNNANTGSCGVTFNCTAIPDNSDKTFWIENGKTYRPMYFVVLCGVWLGLSIERRHCILVTLMICKSMLPLSV